jgi:hypothetical protein
MTTELIASRTTPADRRGEIFLLTENALPTQNPFLRSHARLQNTSLVSPSRASRKRLRPQRLRRRIAARHAALGIVALLVLTIGALASGHLLRPDTARPEHDGSRAVPVPAASPSLPTILRPAAPLRQSGTTTLALTKDDCRAPVYLDLRNLTRRSERDGSDAWLRYSCQDEAAWLTVPRGVIATIGAAGSNGPCEATDTSGKITARAHLRLDESVCVSLTDRRRTVRRVELGPAASRRTGDAVAQLLVTSASGPH